jgi:hypothetical protein
MRRIVEYFRTAKTIPSNERMMGIETESLLVDNLNCKPISLHVSEEIFSDLVENFGWSVCQIKCGKVVKIAKNGLELFYELGWNNFELVTPIFRISDEEIFSANEKHLSEINSSARKFGMLLTNMTWDNHVSNTLVIPDKRDEIWLKLDGNALFGLGHIASVHFNIDLVSIDEGMEFISQLLQLYQSNGWPAAANREIWEGYLKESKAKYQDGRYGPPPTNFDEYCSKLASYNVVMNVIDGELEIAKPSVPFSACTDPNMDMFLRSVWWWMRLRVRGGKLVLEIRDVPRAIPPRESFGIIRNALNI